MKKTLQLLAILFVATLLLAQTRTSAVLDVAQTWTARQTFGGGISGILTATCADTSGSTTAQNCTSADAHVPSTNDCVVYTTTSSNSGTGLTTNVNSLGAVSIAIPGSGGWTTTLSTGIIPANKPLHMCYDGTNWNVQQTGTAAGSIPMLTSGVVCSAANWSGTGYFPLTGTAGTACGDATQSRIMTFPASYTVKNLVVSMATASSTAQTICASCTLSVTLMINGVAQTLTCTIGNSASSCSDTSHTVSVTAGQYAIWRTVGTGTFTVTETDLAAAAQIQ